MNALEVFTQQNGDVTKAYYAQLNACGFEDELACALFRAQKRSEAAKSYRGGKYRRAAYDVKNWSISEICSVLQCATLAKEEHCHCECPRSCHDANGFCQLGECECLEYGWNGSHVYRWGWQRDPSTPGYEWVLYVELPTGQVSFHSADRLAGPDYNTGWDRQKMSRERILAFCDYVMTGSSCAYIAGPEERRNEETLATTPNLFGALA